MADLLESGAQFIAKTMNVQFSRTVTYVRGQDSAELKATPSRSTFEVDSGTGIVRVVTRDYIVKVADLVHTSGRFLPQRGDRIIEMGADGAPVEYEVTNVGSEPEWRQCDPYGLAIRVHTKQVGEVVP